MAEKVKGFPGGITAGICTSGSRVKVALLRGGRFSVSERKALNQEKVVFSMFDRLLGKGAGLADIGTLCVVTGPGRFTGLRVGLTLASALRTMAGTAVYSSTLFEILAAQAAASPEFRSWAEGRPGFRLAALVHAFKDEFFCQLFGRGGRSGFPEPLEGPRWLKDSEVGAYMKSAGGELYAVADAEERPDIYSLAPAGCARAPDRLSAVLPEFIIRAGLAGRNRSMKPLYLKPAKYETSRPAAAPRAGGRR